MEKQIVENAREAIKKTRYLGHGVNARCYLTASSEVVKIFKDNYRTQELFKYKAEMKDHVERLSELGNNSYLAPTKEIICDGKLIGYVAPYGGRKTFDRIDKNISFEKFNELYERLIDDTYEVSDRKFRLGDLHDKNIIVGEQISIIDLDHGNFFDSCDANSLFKKNARDITYIIINSLFGCHNTTAHDIKFNYLDYEHAYEQLLKGEYSLEEFYYSISELMRLNNPTIKEFTKSAKKVLSYQNVYDYYRHY